VQFPLPPTLGGVQQPFLQVNDGLHGVWVQEGTQSVFRLQPP
jgi:hypothetical protein